MAVGLVLTKDVLMVQLMAIERAVDLAYKKEYKTD